MDKSFMQRYRQEKPNDTLNQSFKNDIERGKKLVGGKWSKDNDGTSVFSPYGRMLEKYGSGQFSSYFSENKPNVRLDISKYGLGNAENIVKIKDK